MDFFNDPPPAPPPRTKPLRMDIVLPQGSKSGEKLQIQTPIGVFNFAVPRGVGTRDVTRITVTLPAPLGYIPPPGGVPITQIRNLSLGVRVTLLRGGTATPPATLAFKGTTLDDLKAACATALGCDANDIFLLERKTLNEGKRKTQVIDVNFRLHSLNEGDELTAWTKDGAEGFVGGRSREQRDEEGRAAAIAVGDDEEEPVTPVPASAAMVAVAPAAPAASVDGRVMEWLRTHRLEGCAQALADFGVEEMRDLPEVTRDDLVKMGMRELQIRRFLTNRWQRG
jgi:hypothetical protein